MAIAAAPLEAASECNSRSIGEQASSASSSPAASPLASNVTSLSFKTIMRASGAAR